LAIQQEGAEDVSLPLSRTITKQGPRPQETVELGLGLFVQEAFEKKMPSLIPFVKENRSLLNLARFLKRQKRSPRTLYQYAFGVHRYCRWIEKTPDELIGECFNRSGEFLPKVVAAHIEKIEDFVDALQDEGLATGTINNHVKGVKALYRVNKLKVELSFHISKKVTYKDRAPTPEEVQKLIEVADVRERAIISLLCLA